MIENELSRKTQRGERIGVIGSPSTNISLAIDTLEQAYDRGLVGNFCIVEFVQDGKPLYSIGQVAQISLSNPYLERASIRKIISVRGQATHLTEKHDIRLLKMLINSAYVWDNSRFIPTTVGSVPPTGTPVFLLNQEVVDELVKQQKDELFFVGKMYNTNIFVPFIFRHFGPIEDKGLGEAYHIGVFGKTGSGKSFLAKMLLAAYARNKSMSIIVFDSTGEYSREIRESGPLHRFLVKLGREVRIYDITEISLHELSTLQHLLTISKFLLEMGVRAETNQEYAADLIAHFFERVRTIRTLDGREIDTLSNAGDRTVFGRLVEFIRENVSRIYRGADGQAIVLEHLRDVDGLFQKWRPIMALFSQDKTSIESILSEAYTHKRIVFIDFSGEVQKKERVFWNDAVKAIALREIVNSLQNVGSKYYRENKFLNLLVAIDEAHRFVPREKPSDEDYQALKAALVDCIRTTRKYGLGWLFISQSLASLDLEILRQMRLYFVGYGLSWGTELYTLRDMIGGGAHIELYQSFRDPQTSAILGEKQYPFMVFGPGVSPLSVSGAPLFFNALHYTQEFPAVNKLG